MSNLIDRDQLVHTPHSHELIGQAGQIVVAPANTYHGFTNTGTDELRLTAIHTASSVNTEWLSEPDADWVTPRRP